MADIPTLERFEGAVAVMSDGMRIEFPEGVQVAFRTKEPELEFTVDRYKLGLPAHGLRFGIMLPAGANVYLVEKAKRYFVEAAKLPRPDAVVQGES